jgi:hypothetical protein
MGLNGQTPAERCGIKIEGNDKWLTLIQNAEKLRQLSRDDAKNLYNEYRDIIANELSKKVGISKERALALYPEP